MLSIMISKQLHGTQTNKQTKKNRKKTLLVLMAITFFLQEDGEIECTQQISTDLNTISHRGSEQQASISNKLEKKQQTN